MSIIESFSLFFRPPSSELYVLLGQTEPWIFLSSALVSFVLTTLCLWYRPLWEGKESIWRFSPLPMNAMLLSWCFVLISSASLLSISGYREQGFSAFLLFLPGLFSFLLCYFSLRLVSYAVNSKLNIVTAALMIELAIIFQVLMSLPGISGVSLARFDLGLFFIAVCFSGLFVWLALWLRFSPQKHDWWDRNLSVALLSAGLLTFSALILPVFMRDVIILSMQADRLDAEAFNYQDIVIILSLGSLFIAVLTQMFNALLRLKVKIIFLDFKGNELESLIQTAPDAIIALDHKGNITFFNHSAQTLLGWDASEVMGKNVKVLVTDDHKHRHDKYIAHFLERQDPSVVGSVREVMAKKKDDTLLPIRLAIGYQAEDEQGYHGFVATITDISEQHHLSRALKENANQYRALIGNLPCIAFREMTGSAWHIVYISEAAKFITGYSASVLTGENGASHFMDGIHKEDIFQYREVREKASQKNGKYDCEYRFQTRNHEEKWFWEIGHSYRAEDGSTWIDGIILDITKKREAQEDRREKSRLAENATKSKTTFLANMSYEFRSPMNSILGLTNILLSNEKTPSRRHHLEVIKESGESLLKLINDILDTSKLESQSFPLDLHDFSLLQLSRQIEFTGKETVRARGGDVRLFYSDKLAEHYVGDAQRIKQLLQNMIRSALNKNAQCNLGLHILPVNDSVRFAVSTYSNQDAKEREKGSVQNGYALSATLTGQLVDLMHGELWFDVGSMHGSLAYADLPIIASQHNGKTIHESTDNYAFPVIEVLLIDDVRKNQQELRDMSLRKGIKVLTCDDIQSAENVIKTQQIDVVLLDVYLEDDADTMLNTLRNWAQGSGRPPLRVIAMKVVVDELSDNAWISRGFDSVLNKPFEKEGLFEALRVSLDLDESTSNITSIKPINSGSELRVFDETYATQRWPTSEILLNVLKEFAFHYRALPKHIDEMLYDQADALLILLRKAKEAAHYLGFQKVEQEIMNILHMIESANEKEVRSRSHVLEERLNESFEKAMACLGIREDVLFGKEQEQGLSPELFARKTEQFILKLTQGEFDASLYKELIPEIVAYVDPPLLAEFIEAIENFELDDAYYLFLSMVERFPAAQQTGENGYGI